MGENLNWTKYSRERRLMSGIVDSLQSIDRAAEIARSVKNVKSVENGLGR
jgi:osmotically-inducible protein OsmY